MKQSFKNKFLLLDIIWFLMICTVLVLGVVIFSRGITPMKLTLIFVIITLLASLNSYRASLDDNNSILKYENLAKDSLKNFNDEQFILKGILLGNNVKTRNQKDDCIISHTVITPMSFNQIPPVEFTAFDMVRIKLNENEEYFISDISKINGENYSLQAINISKDGSKDIPVIDGIKNYNLNEQIIKNGSEVIVIGTVNYDDNKVIQDINAERIILNTDNFKSVYRQQLSLKLNMAIYMFLAMFFGCVVLTINMLSI